MKILVNYILDKSGLFIPYPSMAIKEQIEKIAKGFEQLAVNIEKPYPTRSSEQNKFFWGIVQEIAKASGADFDDIEDEIKERALTRGFPYTLNTVNGKPKAKSMTKVNTVQMGLLIDEAIQFAAEQGVIISYKNPEYSILG